MALPSLARLSDHPPAALRAIAKRLAEIGLSPARVGPVVAAVEGLQPAQRRPVRAHHLRKMREPVAFAMRALLFADPVTDSEAKKAFRDRLPDLLATGLLERRPAAAGPSPSSSPAPSPSPEALLVSPFTFGLFNDLFIVSDDLTVGADAVMGFGASTVELCRAAFPEARVGRALDLGCGAGTCALVLAAAADRVVATDIHPRALELAAVNARLNGLSSVELRAGSLFEPVRGEVFDLIASQPPFIAHRAGDADAAFLDGGARGDELALALLRDLAAHLAPGGRAVLRVDWPEHGAETLEQRLRAAAGPELDLLVLRAPAITPDEHAASFAAGLHPALGDAFERDCIARRAHLASQGIRAIWPTLTVLGRPPKGPVQTGTLDIAPLTRVAITSGRIDRLLAGRRLAAGAPDASAAGARALLAAKLRVPDGTVFEQEQPAGGDEGEPVLHARFTPSAALASMRLTPERLFLATFVHEAETVEAGLAAFARETESAEDETRERLLPEVSHLLATGLLELV